MLQRHAPGDIRTHLLGWQVAMRKQKILLALRALRKVLLNYLLNNY